MTSSKIISKQDMFASKFFKVSRMELEKDGKTRTKDFIERTPFVLVVPLTAHDEIYMVSQYRDALRKVSLEIVAGQMDPDEDPLEAAKRELQEEAGLSAKTWKKVATLHVSANMIGQSHVFVATDLTEGETNFDEDEDIETVKMPFKEAINKVLSGEIDVASNIAALLLVDKMKGEGKI